MGDKFDPRVTPARPDLAAAHLRNSVKADRYVEGVTRVVVAPVADMRAEPDLLAPLTTQLLHGEMVTVFEDNGASGMAWVQNQSDGYVGYVASELLGPVPEGDRFWLSAPTAQTYATPKLKSPPTGCTLPYLSTLWIVGRKGGYVELGTGGWTPEQLVHDGEPAESDFVAVAERFIGAPYLWGGRSIFGLDCSALVQLSLMACGIPCPRDSDMQQSIGREAKGSPLRGDLIFWKGHVGILGDTETLLHANAHHMQVVYEPLETAIARISQSDGPVTARRRLKTSAN